MSWQNAFVPFNAGAIPASLIPSADNTFDVGSSSKRWRNIYWGTQALGPDGSAAVPSYSFSADPDTGIYRGAANTLDLSVGGALAVEVAPTYFYVGPQLRTADGVVGTPAWSFAADTDTGFYRIAANEVGLSLGGARQFRFAGTSIFGDTDFPKLDLSNAAGVQLSYQAIRLLINATNVRCDQSQFLVQANGTAAAPSLSFPGDEDTGVYPVGANLLGFAVAGARQFKMDTPGVLYGPSDTAYVQLGTNVAYVGAGASLLTLDNTTFTVGAGALFSGTMIQSRGGGNAPVFIMKDGAGNEELRLVGSGGGGAGALSFSTSAGAIDTRLQRSAAKKLTLDDGAGGAADLTIVGLINWVAGNQQATVGAAGAAAAPPASPERWLRVKDSAGTTLVLAAYLAA